MVIPALLRWSSPDERADALVQIAVAAAAGLEQQAIAQRTRRGCPERRRSRGRPPYNLKGARPPDSPPPPRAAADGAGPRDCVTTQPRCFLRGRHCIRRDDHVATRTEPPRVGVRTVRSEHEVAVRLVCAPHRGRRSGPAPRAPRRSARSARRRGWRRRSRGARRPVGRHRVGLTVAVVAVAREGDQPVGAGEGGARPRPPARPGGASATRPSRSAVVRVISPAPQRLLEAAVGSAGGRASRSASPRSAHRRPSPSATGGSSRAAARGRRRGPRSGRCWRPPRRAC